MYTCSFLLCADGHQVRHVEGTEKSHVGYFRMSPFRTFTLSDLRRYFAVVYPNYVGLSELFWFIRIIFDVNFRDEGLLLVIEIHLT